MERLGRSRLPAGSARPGGLVGHWRSLPSVLIGRDARVRRRRGDLWRVWLGLGQVAKASGGGRVITIRRREVAVASDEGHRIRTARQRHGPDGLPSRGKAFEKRLGLDISTLRLVETGEVFDRIGDLAVLGAEHTRSYRDRPPQEPFGLNEPPAVRVRRPQDVTRG